MNDEYEKYEVPNADKICFEAFLIGCCFSIVPAVIYAVLYYIVLF